MTKYIKRFFCLLSLTFLLCVSPEGFADRELLISSPEPIPVILPVVSANLPRALILEHLCSPLTQKDVFREKQQQIVKGYSSSDDFLTWYLFVQPDIKFASGKQLAWSDFEYSVQFAKSTYASPEYSSHAPPFLINFLENIDSVSGSAVMGSVSETTSEQGVDQPPQTWKINFKRPQPTLVPFINQICIMDQSVSELFGDNLGTGTFLATLGPYQISQVNRELHLRMTQEESNYNLPENAPTSISISYYPSDIAAFKALESLDVAVILFPTSRLLHKSLTYPDIKASGFSPHFGFERLRPEALLRYWGGNKNDSVKVDKILTKTIETSTQAWLAEIHTLRYFHQKPTVEPK